MCSSLIKIPLNLICLKKFQLLRFILIGIDSDYFVKMN